jgi:hypothetical protein
MTRRTRRASPATRSPPSTKIDAGALWIGTGGFGIPGAGLDRLDVATGAFTHFRHDPDDPTSVSSDTIAAIVADRRWRPVGGRRRFQPGRRRLEPLSTARRASSPVSASDPNDPTSLASDDVIALHRDKAGASLDRHLGRRRGSAGGGRAGCALCPPPPRPLSPVQHQRGHRLVDAGRSVGRLLVWHDQRRSQARSIPRCSSSSSTATIPTRATAWALTWSARSMKTAPAGYGSGCGAAGWITSTGPPASSPTTVTTQRPRQPAQ